MKRLLCLLFALAAMVSLCACQGNFGSVNLKDPVDIPENGVIDQSTVMQIKNENAIAVFVGTSGDFKYEWTVFAGSIRDAKAVNLGVRLSKTNDGSIRVVLNQTEAFGFSASLAIHLNECWSAQSATAHVGENAVATVSVTGSRHTILNVTLDGTAPEIVIRPDLLPEKVIPTVITTAPLPLQGTDAPAVTKPQAEMPPTATTVTPAPTVTVTKPAVPPTVTKDKYNTDPVPEGKPTPVEPEDQEVDKGSSYTCTFSIECSTILNNLSLLDPEKLEMVPYDGVILAEATVVFYEGESVFDVLQRVCIENKIHTEASWTPMYNSAYVEGIYNLYEFDCGALSGWMYRVNGWYPNYGCSRYQLKDGDVVEWRYTCDMGNDIGGGYAVGG